MKIHNRDVQRYLILCLGIGALLALSYMVERVQPLYAAGCLALGVAVVLDVYRRDRVLVSPVTLLCAVWLMMVPLTSFRAPLMNAMTDFECRICLLAALSLSLGGAAAAGMLNRSGQIHARTARPCTITEAEYAVALILLITSIGAFLVQYRRMGAFPATTPSPSLARSIKTFAAYSILSTLGCLAIFFVGADSIKRRRKSFVLLLAAYLFFQLMTSVRFSLFLIAIMHISGEAGRRVNGAALKRLILTLSAMACAFLFAQAFRGNQAEKQRFFVDTGLFTGTSLSISSTEIVRYFGMSQRTMSAYFQLCPPGEYAGAYTFYPWLKAVKTVLLRAPVSIYGSTATNAISFLYLDFGWAWPLALGTLSFAANGAYYRYLRSPWSLISRYAWGVACIFLVMSFYAYFQHYVYWLVHFPFLLALMRVGERFVRNARRRANG